MANINLSNSKKDEILEKITVWIKEHFDDTDLLFLLKTELDLSDNEIEALGWDIKEIRENIDAQKEEYLDYLKKVVKECCNEDGCINVYWDYRDSVSKDIIQNYINNVVGGMTEYKLHCLFGNVK